MTTTATAQNPAERWKQIFEEELNFNRERCSPSNFKWLMSHVNYDAIN